MDKKRPTKVCVSSAQERWDNGEGLAAIWGVDRIRKI